MRLQNISNCETELLEAFLLSHITSFDAKTYLMLKKMVSQTGKMFFPLKPQPAHYIT